MTTSDPTRGILVQGISKRYPSVLALDKLDLSCEPGAMVAVVGPSGCGKSTLLRLLAGLEDPTDGRILIHGETPQALRTRGRVGMSFQQPSLLPWRTVARNVALATEVTRQAPDPSFTDKLLKLVRLDGWRSRYPGELSGGMKQRVALARALSTKPDLLLLDEPFSALDEPLRKQLHADLESLRHTEGLNPTTIVVTHAVSDAVFLADLVIVMTARPGSLAKVIEVALPRPRLRALWRSSDFMSLCLSVEEAFPLPQAS